VVGIEGIRKANSNKRSNDQRPTTNDQNGLCRQTYRGHAIYTQLKGLGRRLSGHYANAPAVHSFIILFLGKPTGHLIYNL